jgi:hypothetical protein
MHQDFSQQLETSTKNIIVLKQLRQSAKQKIADQEKILEEQQAESKRRRADIAREEGALVTLEEMAKKEATEAAIRKFTQTRLKENIAKHLSLDPKSADFANQANSAATKKVSQLMFDREKPQKKTEMSHRYTWPLIERLLSNNLLGEAGEKEKIIRGLEKALLPDQILTVSEKKQQLAGKPECRATILSTREIKHIRQISEAVHPLYRLIGVPDTGQILFFIYEIMSLRPHNGQSFGQKELSEKLATIGELLKCRYPSKSNLHNDILALTVHSQDTPQTCAHRILNEYVKKNWPKETKETQQTILEFVAKLNIDDSRAKIKPDAYLWHRHQSDQTIGAIIDVILNTSHFLKEHAAYFNQPGLRNNKYYQNLHTEIQKTALANSKFIQLDILIALQDTFAIIEYLKQVLILHLQERTRATDEDIASFKQWANYHFYGQPKSPEIAQPSEKRAHSFFTVQNHLVRSECTLQVQTQIWAFLNTLVQHEQNPSALMDSIHQEMGKADAGRFAASKTGVTQILREEMNKPRVALHPSCSDSDATVDTINKTGALDRRSKAILRSAIQKDNSEDALRAIDSSASASIAAVRRNSWNSAIEADLKEAIDKEPIRDIGQSQQQTKIAQLTGEEKIHLQKVEQTTRQITQLKRQLETAEHQLLNLLRQQTLLAFIKYVTAINKDSRHTERGLRNAHNLLRNLCNSTCTFGNGLQLMLQFLNQKHNLLDESFTTKLLSQLLAKEDGVLRSSLVRQQYTADIRQYAANSVAHFKKQRQQLKQCGFKDLTTIYDLALKTLINNAKRYSGKGGTSTPAIVESNSVFHGITGRSTLFGLIENPRLEAEKTVKAQLSFLHRSTTPVCKPSGT